MSEPTNAQLIPILRGVAVEPENRGSPGAATFVSLAVKRLEAKEEVSEALKIETFGGNCPVQAEGTINGIPFYFRARGQHWSFGVGADPISEPDWCHSEKWCEDRFGAGWMEETIARRLIDESVKMYLATAAIKATQETT